MMTRTAVVLGTLQSVQLFMTRNAGRLGDLDTSALRQALDQIEAELSAHASTQTSAANGTTAAIARRRVLRNILLVKYLRPISAIAGVELEQSTDFIALRLPKSIKTTQQILAAADSMGAAAANHADTFIAAGMAPTFLSDLQAAAAALKAGAAARNLIQSSKIGATDGLKVATRQARKIVKALDALIEPLLAGDPALLSQWKATKRYAGRPMPIATATTDVSATMSAEGEGGPFTAPA